MQDRDKPTLREVHQTEPNPYEDRQNFEPEPSDRDLEDTGDFEAEMDDYDEGDYDDLEDDEVSSRSRSDIVDFAPEESDDDPSEDEDPRNSDDDDPWGDGIHDTPLVKRYEDMADRDELARRVEELVADAYDWAGRAQDDDAQDIYETLLDVAERLGNPPEDTTRTEPGEIPQDRDEADA